MNKFLLYVSVVASLGGFLFGFDSGVISGAEKAIQAEFGLSSFWHGLIISGALIGTLIGVFTAGRPSDRYGRKKTLWAMAILFAVSAVGCAFTPHRAVGPHALGWFRFIGGLAIGGVSVVVPLYIVEIAPGKWRGLLVGLNQLNIVFGILASYVTNYLVARFLPNVDPEVVWRVMLGVECLPIALFMALLATIPESPRWLVRVGRKALAAEVLSRVGEAEVERVVGEIEESVRAVTLPRREGTAGTLVDVPLFQRKFLKPILLAFFIAFFNQVSGINAINYYAPRIFEMIFGEGSSLAALAGTMGLGLTNLLFTAMAFAIIDRVGRRVLIIIGAAAMIVMHTLVAWQLALPQPNAVVAMTGIFGFIAFFAMSSGACLWVYISEVFPNTVRAKGQALGCFTHWFLCTVISWVFPMCAERAGSWTFAFFAAMMACQLVWAVFFMPETKGGTTEDIESRLGIR